ncbi:hypothetical protein PLICRDRAFT_696458 [Plicaturopsis crispa FD-325 SS-3]|nr:hypothetical protein PLICRDRAFT_696458 [Plicaturopsis crispa FD-325 SS-3]
MPSTMRAVVYEKPFKVSVQQVERPKITHPDDIIVKVTTTCVCGSDLHMYEGRTAAQSGIVFGHENMGIVSVSLTSRSDHHHQIRHPKDPDTSRRKNASSGNKLRIHNILAYRIYLLSI